MNYFHTVSVYQLLNAILFCKKNCSDQKNCIFIRDILLPKIKNMDYIYKLFDKVVIYGDYWSGKTVQEQEKIIQNYYDGLLKENGIDLSNLSDDEWLIVGCAHNTFGMYLSIKQIQFTFLEDAAGLLTRAWLLDSINKKQSALKYEMICKYGLITGKSPCIKNYICDFAGQDAGFDSSDERYINFCVVQELSNLDESERIEIINLFADYSPISVRDNSMIILTQHFANLRTLLFDEQILIYQIFMDYFTKGYDVIFKPHPDDLMFYPLLFPNVQIIHEKFPAEFLSFMFDHKPKALATISSTSSFSLRTVFDNIIEMGVSFESEFKNVHRYFVALKEAEKISADKQVVVFNCDKSLVEMLAKIHFPDITVLDYSPENCYKNAVIIADSKDENNEEVYTKVDENLADNTFVFLNSNKSFGFYNVEKPQIWDSVVPIVINKHLISKDFEFCVSDLDSEVIYVITLNEEVKKMVRNTKFKHELPSTGIELEVDASVTPEQERIKVLEGKLEATEKRLLSYIKLCEELKKNSK